MAANPIHYHGVVIVGGGLAGLRASLECARMGLDVAVLSKVHPLRSHSVAAQGGINAALGNAPGGEDDSWERHAFDTVKGSDYLADQDAVETMCRQAPEVVVELEHMGVVFSRFSDGRIAQRPFGGAGFPRTCYAADRTGHNLLHTLYEQTLSMGVRFYEEYYVTSLVVNDGECAGCTALHLPDGSLHAFSAKALLLATGGYGRIYSRSTNALINTGDGASLAYASGVPLKDMEFVQFHPTTLYGTNILITEGARGEGGHLYNSKRDRFMRDYAAKAMELAPRDIVARAIQTEIDQGRGFGDQYVHLDLTHLGSEKIRERLPGIRQIVIDFAGVDPIDEPLPVQPGQHYSMGGIASNADGATPLPGLYAAGECACVSVHGANRLGGNSLLETVVFGKLAGRTLTREAPERIHASSRAYHKALELQRARLSGLLAPDDGEILQEVRDELKRTMFEYFGIFRDEKKMTEGLGRLRELKVRSSSLRIRNRSPVYNLALVHALQLKGMLRVAEVVAMGALAREESRGSHYRTDFPARNDNRFLAHTVAHYRNGTTILQYSPITLGMFEVKERTY